MLIWNNNSVTGNIVLQEDLILCKNTLDCPGSLECCYIEDAEGGFCGKRLACSAIIDISAEEKGIDKLLEYVNYKVFFNPKNGIVIGIMVTSLIGLVFTMRRDN
ncbi:hypothetical protein COV93_06100 [Candidatus Woesearchaeota archaeon CG11_big_fil_rev_8_21_14_0_20_43_8]|nr:MAG: hypothetical protein COV93_06100 [Candidatus Woesearchaeota archaeon CG11_big_fil_rev_8_21_14_0_20_43_8]PIO04877.1 MAG: hypothetical protein COT47_07120 [Candidatus Woesearchaeota archaeon CG08_land_8_20_14_0_20_43_7]